MQGNKIIKSVSFNLANAEDEFILEVLKRRNFSGYVKKLILDDLKAKAGQEIEETRQAKPLTAAERLEQAKQRQKSGQSPAPN